MGIFQILALVIVLLVFVALIKFHIPLTIILGSLGLLFYILSVDNEMSKGVSFNVAWQSPSVFFPPLLVLLIGLLGLISLLIGIYIEIKKRK